MKLTTFTIVVLLLLFCIAVMLQQCNKQTFAIKDSYGCFDMGTGTYHEPFVGILSSRPAILVWSLKIPPYKYFADDTLKFRREFNVEFNDESVRFYEQKGEVSIIVIKAQKGVVYTPSTIAVAANNKKMRFSTTCAVNPILGNTVTMSKMELSNAAVDEVNSKNITSTGHADIADCRAKQIIDKPWVLWYLWLLTALLPFIIIFLFIGGNDKKEEQDKKENKVEQAKKIHK